MEYWNIGIALVELVIRHQALWLQCRTLADRSFTPPLPSNHHTVRRVTMATVVTVPSLHSSGIKRG